MDNESQDVNQGSADAPVTSSVAEETPATPAETQVPETDTSSEPAADESASEPTEEPKTVPYSRFKEVNDELRTLRDSAPRYVEPAPVNPASGYLSYDPQLGYPTDPGEFARFSAVNAAQFAVEQTRTRLDIDELESKYPNEVKDPAFIGAVVAIQRDAASRGQRLSFAKAADKFQESIARYKKEGFEEARSGEVAKTGATVARSQSKSSTAGGNVKTLTVDEFAKLSRSQQRARYGEFLTALQSEE